MAIDSRGTKWKTRSIGNNATSHGLEKAARLLNKMLSGKHGAVHAVIWFPVE